MSQHTAPTKLPADAVVPQEGGQSVWVRWLVFAGLMMVVLGTFNALQGLVALLNPDWYSGPDRMLLSLGFTAEGWLWLVFGIVIAFAGVGVLAGLTWARVVGVVAAFLNAVDQLAFVAAYPFWSVLVIAIDIVVIYALTAHGAELGQPGMEATSPATGDDGTGQGAGR